MKNKFKALAFMLSLLFTGALFIPAIEAKASYLTPICPGMYKCNGCTSSSCNVYKVQKITVKFTASECATIAKRAQKVDDWGFYVTGIVGVIKTVPGVVLSFLGKGVANNSKIFQTAASKNTGLTISYEFVIAKSSNAASVYRNTTYSFK